MEEREVWSLQDAVASLTGEVERKDARIKVLEDLLRRALPRLHLDAPDFDLHSAIERALAWEDKPDHDPDGGQKGLYAREGKPDHPGPTWADKRDPNEDNSSAIKFMRDKP